MPDLKIFLFILSQPIDITIICRNFEALNKRNSPATKEGVTTMAKHYEVVLHRNTGTYTSTYTNKKEAIRGANSDGYEYGCAATVIKVENGKYFKLGFDGTGKEVIETVEISQERYDSITA